MKKYDLIALDMDGTLLTSNHQITKGSQEAIAKVTECNKYAVLSTGRTLDELKDYKGVLKNVPYYICESGALLYDCKEEKILYQECMREEEIEKIFEVIQRFDTMPYFASNGMTVVEKKRMGHMADFYMGQYEEMMQRTVSNFIEEDMIDYYRRTHCNVEKFNVYSTSPELRDVVFEELKALNLPVTMVYSEISSIEISPNNVSKAKGLKNLCEHLNLPIEKTIAIGDADNDIEVMKVAGLAVAMGNAQENVKEICDVVVADCDHDGCKEAMDTYML